MLDILLFAFICFCFAIGAAFVFFYIVGLAMSLLDEFDKWQGLK